MSFFTKKRNLYFISLLLVGLFIYLFWIKKDKQDMDATVTDSTNKDSIPSMSTDSITMLVSDSGLIKYKLLTKTWLSYDQVKEPYHLFPDKFYGEQFDSAFNVVVTIEADTVWNYTKKKLWILRGNVVIKNIQNETFKSEELYWDERKGTMYSDKYVEVIRPDNITLHGLEGFEANHNLTAYELKNVKRSEVYIDENKTKQEEVEE